MNGDTDTTTKKSVPWANKAIHGLNAAALVFLYSTFATKENSREGYEEIRALIAAEHRDAMDREEQCEARFERIAMRLGIDSGLTNSGFAVKVE